MGLFGRFATYEKALRAGERGASADAAVMAVVIERAAAQQALDLGPDCSWTLVFDTAAEIWRGAQARGLSVAQVVGMLDEHGLEGANRLMGGG